MMSKAETSLHVYQREIPPAFEVDDSLSVIARMIPPGHTLLDLGMGAGGLGKYLSQRQAITADGVTLNPHEADIARAWYRQALVVDLDVDDLGNLFGDKRYDFIVCADVLEHLKWPQRVLDQCRRLLKPEGRLLTSIPNAGYCGLIAELIQGDFRYRSEGLLDETHLRFFTRASLQRFFSENGWATSNVQIIQRSLDESEFRGDFDSLPPSVARYLLAMPDALTYQFISVLQPDSATVEGTATEGQLARLVDSTKQASFSAQLYLAVGNAYSESRKLVVAGRIGDPRQTLGFNIEPSQTPYTAIRLDPADRPGFFRLHRILIRLRDGTVVWSWGAGQDPLTLLMHAPQQQIVVSTPWELSSGALLMLHGDDPWIELPMEQDVLRQVSETGARLEVLAGWPMSADYLQASQAINSFQVQTSLLHQREISRLSQHHEQIASQQRQVIERKQTELATLEKAHTDAINELRQLAVELSAMKQYLDSARLQHRTELEEAQQRAKSERQQLESQLESQLIAQAQAERARLKGELQSVQEEMLAGKQHLMTQLRSAQRDRNVALAQFNQIAAHLESVERSRLFRMTRPISHLKGRVDRLLGRAQHSAMVTDGQPVRQPATPTDLPIDIIVPVYRGLEDTRRCVESVLAAPGHTSWRLIVINDCSPEPEVTQWLRDMAIRDERIVLLENVENLGFVETVNRGMALSKENDVVLLNSDAEVANDWLDRLKGAAYCDRRVATVTPFSNNATICSYPRFCAANELPDGYDTASLDRLFATQLAGQAVEVPTGVGFCMYIRRQCLAEIGLFDVANFGKGYGEENDFCIRAEEAGWANLHALDVFVRHAGGISFGDSKSERELAAMQTLRRLHPGYESNVHGFLARDPARSARLTIDLARITCSDRPVILNIMHDREGGTLRHVRELAHRLAAKATFLRLAPTPGGAELTLEGAHEAFSVRFALPQEQPSLIETLQKLQVGHVHFHHLLGHAPDICDLPDQLGVTHDFTAHDYYTYCPQISLTDHTDRYCGEKGLEQCRQCLHRNPAPGGESVESWRERHGRLLRNARLVIAPSNDAAQRLQNFVPAAKVVIVPHSTLGMDAQVSPRPSPKLIDKGEPLRIVVLGALSKIKGADLLEEVAAMAAKKSISVEFHLLGYAYRSLLVSPKSHLTVHGAYQERDLPSLLQSLQADAVWFPALWPETYSYTLSASLDSGLPIIAPDLGAFAERLQNREWTWLCDWQQSAGAWLEFFGRIREDHFCTGRGPVPILDSTSLSSSGQLHTGVSLDYGSRYLKTLPTPSIPDAEALQFIQQDLNAREDLLSPTTTTAAKSVTLRTIVRLRSSPVLSPVARMIPMHLQRRVKSWLVK